VLAGVDGDGCPPRDAPQRDAVALYLDARRGSDGIGDVDRELRKGKERVGAGAGLLRAVGVTRRASRLREVDERGPSCRPAA
jgi:hypothetical protein